MKGLANSVLLLLTVTVLALRAGPAAAGGINLAWDDCGTAGVPAKLWACNTNTGNPFSLVGSFKPEPGMTNYVGFNAELDIEVDGAGLPDWWKHGASLCRGSGGLNTNVDFTSGPFGCLDAFVGQGVGGFAYSVGEGGANRAHLRIQGAIPVYLATSLDESLEYYAFKANIQRTKSTLTGACSGCESESSEIVV